MILGPDDPRAVTGAEWEEARRNTERWNAILGLIPLTAAEQAKKDDLLRRVLDIVNQPPDTTVTVESESGWTTDWKRYA